MGGYWLSDYIYDHGSILVENSEERGSMGCLSGWTRFEYVKIGDSAQLFGWVSGRTVLRMRWEG